MAIRTCRAFHNLLIGKDRELHADNNESPSKEHFADTIDQRTNGIHLHAEGLRGTVARRPYITLERYVYGGE